MNNKIQTGCGIAAAVFMALGFIMEFVCAMLGFFGVEDYYLSYYYLYAALSLFVFVVAVVAFAFGVVSLTHNGDKAVVSEILIAVCFVMGFFYLNSFSAYFAAVFIAIAAILYSIYFASVMAAQKSQTTTVQPKGEASFEDKAERLVSYKRMLDEGLLSEEEFAAIKKNVLGE